MNYKNLDIMKKLFLPIFLVLFILGCQKETINNGNQSIDLEISNKGPSSKIDVCHQAQGNNTWHLINISENAWPAHEAHGDVRLDDQDDDGYVPDNECEFGQMGDCDDTNVDINPGEEEICDNGIDDDCDGDIDEECCPLNCCICSIENEFILEFGEFGVFCTLPFVPNGVFTNGLYFIANINPVTGLATEVSIFYQDGQYSCFMALNGVAIILNEPMSKEEAEQCIIYMDELAIKLNYGDNCP